MLNLPSCSNISAVQTRVHKIISVAHAEGDSQLLQQLWCLLRNTEMAMVPSDDKALLHQMRDKVMQEMAELDGQPVHRSVERAPAAAPH